MTQLLPVLASPLSQVKKGSIGVELSYELSNMCSINMYMACCFWSRLQAIETSVKKIYIIKGDEITRRDV
jgi:hypothetical protein